MDVQKQSLSETRRALARSLKDKREQLAHRLSSRASSASSPLLPARALVEASSDRIRALVRPEGHENGDTQAGAAISRLSPADLHTIERLLSYIRHSVVRVSFYNVNLFCPSLLDEYTTTLRDQVIGCLKLLPAVRQELEEFFAVSLADGTEIRALWPDALRNVSLALDGMDRLSRDFGGRLDEVKARTRLAENLPPLIHETMNALQRVQDAIDEAKLNVEELVREAVAVVTPQAERSGLCISVAATQTPKILAQRGSLLNACVEVILNAARYSGGGALSVEIGTEKNKRFVEVNFKDDGAGMTGQELRTCLHRGVSHRGGTGEGLSMVVEIVEGEHLGELDIQSAPGTGCQVTLRLPIKWEPARGSADA